MSPIIEPDGHEHSDHDPHSALRTAATEHDPSQVLGEAPDEAAVSDDPEDPRMFHRSARFMFRAVPRALDPMPSEYVAVDWSHLRTVEAQLAVANYNMMWEAAQYRSYLAFDPELPDPLRELADRDDTNIMFVPRTRSGYWEYAPLLHLLPARELRRFGLPVLGGRHWPYTVGYHDVDEDLPDDFGVRLGRAWASRVWRDLCSGSPQSAFTDRDPITLLAHNLDFWVPAATEVIYELLRELPAERSDLHDREPLELDDGTVLDGLVVGEPRGGRDLWRGDTEAARVARRVVERADDGGRLRGILDAVRAGRVEEDFSPWWSPAREDFERKLYRKRDKIKVRFVELDDTVPVQGPETEILGNLVCADFLALLDPTDRAVVVLLTSGTTKLGDIADVLGYRNHSPVSKRLARIRAQAATYFDNA